MRHSKRHAEILRIVREEGTCAIADLAKRLGVSQETIRRDVKPLAVEGQLLKMHGAVTLPFQVGEAPFERRLRENAEAKKAIAMQAARHIVPLGATAVELVDRTMIELSRDIPMLAPAVARFVEG